MHPALALERAGRDKGKQHVNAAEGKEAPGFEEPLKDLHRRISWLDLCLRMFF